MKDCLRGGAFASVLAQLQRFEGDRVARHVLPAPVRGAFEAHPELRDW